MKRATAITGVILMAANLVTAVDLETYEATYEKQMEEIILSHGMQMTDLYEQYARALNDLLAGVKKAGDLDRTTAVMEEIARFSKENTMPGRPSALPDIQNLRTLFKKQVSAHETKKAKRVIALASQYDQALEGLQKSLVSSSKLDAAKAVQEERKRAQETTLYSDAKKTLARHSAGRSTHPGRRIAGTSGTKSTGKRSSGVLIRLPTQDETRNMVLVTSTEYPTPTPVAELEKDVDFFRRWRNESDVIRAHPPSPNRPSIIDFSQITANHKGKLIVRLHPHPGHDCDAALIIGDQTHTEVTLKDDKWITVECRFDHEEVIVEGRAGGDKRWSWEHLFLSYRFAK